jgi:hypothetical protein
MAEAWWSDTQAWRHVCHHYEPPHESTVHAADWLWTRVRHGTVPARYHDASAGVCVSIAPNEWQGSREWPGWEEQARQGRGGGRIEFAAGAVQRLCRPRRKLGRPDMPIKEVLRILAGRWIGHNGRPTVRARLEEYLAQVASDHGEPVGKDTVQRLAQEALDVDRAHDPVVIDD